MAATKTEKLSGNNLTIVMLLITLLVVGVSGLAAKTLIVSILRDNKVVSKEDTADKQLTADVKAAPDLVKAYGELGNTAIVIGDALPTTPDFPSLIVTLENMAAASGVKLKDVTPSQVTVPTPGDTTTATDLSVAPPPESYRFEITFSGTYAGLKTFLNAVETSARPMRVLDMQLAGGGSSLAGQFDLETFYQPKAQLPFGKETVK